MKKSISLIIVLMLVIAGTFTGIQRPFSYADGEITVTATVTWPVDAEKEDIQLQLLKRFGDNEPEAVVFSEGVEEQNPKTLNAGEDCVRWSVAPPEEGYEYLFQVVDVPEGFCASQCISDPNGEENSYMITLNQIGAGGDDEGKACDAPEQFKVSASDNGKSLTLTYVPKDYRENGSSEARTILKSIEGGNLDGFTIETVKLDMADINTKGFWRALQDELGDYDAGQQRFANNVIKRITVPNGTYDIENDGNNPILVYSNTILDLRGTGADNDGGYFTPYDTSDDYSSVNIFSNSHNGCVIRAGKNNEPSEGWDYYKNITVLGGTIHGKNKAGEGITGSNIRFGHTTNARVIGTKVQDNTGAHHIEVGAMNKLLVADCEFTGYKHGDTSEGAKEYCIEAVQFDVTHRATLNFSDYGKCDDLATKNATIVNNTFDNVFRGVGSHHAVLGSYYDNITIKGNTFTNLRDRAINASYFKNSTITNNTMTNVISGIMASSMVYQQFYQPNKNSGIAAKTAVETLNANLKITNNTIKVNGNKDMEEHFTNNPIKYGIKVAGDNVTGTEATATKNEDAKNNPNASGKAVVAGNYYIKGVTVTGNKISVYNAPTNDSQRIKCGLLLWYVKDCANIASNNIDLGGYNAKDNTCAGIKVNHSTGNTVNKNTIKGVTAGSDALGIQVSDGSSGTKVTNNTIGPVAKDGISVTNITGKNVEVIGNTINSPKKVGITIYKSAVKSVNKNIINTPTNRGIILDGKGAFAINIVGNVVKASKNQGIGVIGTVTNINSNTIKDSGTKGIYVKGTATNIKSNTITNSKGGQGICVEGKATTVSNNKITKATQHGILVTGAVTLFEKNTIKNAKKHGIYVNGGAKYAIGNKITGCGSKNVVGLGKGVAAQTKTVTVKRGKTVKIKTFPASGAAWATSKKKIATVNKKGVVKGVRKGTATITAKKNGIKTTVKVIVK